MVLRTVWIVIIMNTLMDFFWVERKRIEMEYALVDKEKETKQFIH